MINGTIADLNNLKFYSDSGYEIYAEKQYTITWSFKEDNDKFRVLPEGFIVADIKELDEFPGIYTIVPSSIQIGFTKNPEIYISQTEENETVTYQKVIDALFFNWTHATNDPNHLIKSDNIIVI